jgi:hypothetical protein
MIQILSALKLLIYRACEDKIKKQHLYPLREPSASTLLLLSDLGDYPMELEASNQPLPFNRPRR